MIIKQRTYDYDKDGRFNEDYHRIHDFLHDVNDITHAAILNFTWGRTNFLRRSPQRK